MSETPSAPQWSALLAGAVTEPGQLSAAYTAFHDYSLGNMLLAMGQCHGRDLPLGPLATFPKWIALGRHVRKGEKALMLCQPITITRTDAAGDEGTVTRFMYKNRWFVLAQTDGDPLPPVVVPDWDQGRALAALDITAIPFDLPDGNTLGYARARTVAISPINPHPHSTLFHELGHILLGHTAETTTIDDERTPRDLREIEAEAIALLVCAALDLPGAEDSRAYIQHWNRSGQAIPDLSARKIFKAADAILRAGRDTVPMEEPAS